MALTSRRAAFGFAAAFIALALAAGHRRLAAAPVSACTIEGVERTVAIGDVHGAADRFVEELKSVTPEAVRRVARKYMKGFRFAYVGDPSKLNPRTISLF